MKIDVWFVNSAPGKFTAAWFRLCKSWDESVYAETNVRALVGSDREVIMNRDSLSVDGSRVVLNSPPGLANNCWDLADHLWFSGGWWDSVNLRRWEPPKGMQWIPEIRQLG